MQKLLVWFRQNWLAAVALFLLGFIPMYPKLPLFDVIRTWVYIRLEDVLVAAVVAAFIVSQWRKRHLPRTPLTTAILVYWSVGLLSAIVSVVFIGPKLANYFPHLVFLHWLRRLEYISLFFVAYNAMRQRENVLGWVLGTLAVTSVGIFVYGLGQKFLGFPAFLTMNEEFAKGVPLRLPPTARIPSTFGGHYDLAAYLVLLIPILGSVVFGLKRLWQKVLFLLLAVASLILLLLTASRVSFGVYLVAVSVMLWWQKKRWLIIPVILISFFLLNTVSSASERFYKTFRFSDVIVDLSTGRPIGTLETLEGDTARIEEIEQPDKESLPQGSGFIGVGDQAGQALKTVEVYRSLALATGSGEVATISGSFLIQKALVYDISITTRFQGQWPKAVEAFRRNILLGSGYSTLSVAADGDYHRMLGETGLLGTIAFLGVLLVAFALFLRGKDKLENLPRAFVIGVFAGIIGLLFNAVLIDVFEASKVAFSLWILLGVALALLSAKVPWKRSYLWLLWRVFTHPIAYGAYLILAVFLVYSSIFSQYFVGDDFTWLRWAAQGSFSDIPKYFAQASGFFYRPLPKAWYLLLYSVFWLKPAAYHFFSLFLHAAVVLAVYLILLRRGIRQFVAWSFSLLFAVLAIHHENVFWVSGQSSLLAATMFMGALIIFQRLWDKRSRLWILEMMSALALLFGAMLSYDGMIVAPLLIVCIGMLLYKPRWSLVWPICLIPLYLWLRIESGAVWPGGDYAYRQSTLLVNSLANGLGYLSAILVGPQVIEKLTVLRQLLRSSKTTLSFVALALTVAAVAALVKGRAVLVRYRNVLVWLLCALIALAAYLGLGGMAERYSYVASIFLVLALASLVDTLWQTTASNPIKAAIVLVLAGLLFWNTRELLRLKGDWQKAGSVAEQTLLSIRQSYFPLPQPTTFVFVNVPIRWGRAWIFPVGLDDALWHMFRSQSTVIVVPSLEEAFKIQVKKNTGREILTFEDYVVKKTVKEIQTLPQ